MHHHVDPCYKVSDPLAFCFNEVKLKRGEVITQLGEVPMWAYFLTEDMLKIFMPDGQIIDIFQPGEFAASVYAMLPVRMQRITSS